MRKDPAEVSAVEETKDILRDPGLLASIRRSREEAAAGLRVPLKDPSHGKLSPKPP